ncbi:MAG: hypothetical protein MUE85_12005 [Microscillaceae bacterium]|jgi:hypothetical protein|nr:hypothetical protein [Microscillaceae bacterium]
MKKIYWVLLAGLFLSSRLFAQQSQVGYDEEFVYEVAIDLIDLEKCDCITGALDSLKVKKNAKATLRFNISQLEDDKILQFLQITPPDDKNKVAINNLETQLQAQNFITSKENNGIFCFKVSNKIFERLLNEKKIQKRYVANGCPKIVSGTLLLPLKLRPALNRYGQERPFEFAANISVGPFVGLRWRMSHSRAHFFTIPLFVGLSPVNINSENSASSTNTEDGLETTIVFSTGLVFQFNDFQAGLLVGRDLVGGERGKNWVYNEKTWFSFGIGYKFLGEKDK